MDRKDLARETVRSFMCTDRMHHRVVENFITDLGMHRSGHILLMHLSRNEGNISQRSLAEHLRISPTAASVKIKKLENDGFIIRKPDKTDARINYVSITPKGREIIEKSEKIFRSIDMAMVNNISDEELSAFIETLKKMHDNLTATLNSKGEAK